jgi:hypothetical protein
MTLNSPKVFSAVHTFIIITSLVSSPLAQTPRDLLGIRQAAAQEPKRTEKEKKAAEELEKKALALIDELVVEAMSLKRAKNRIYVLAVASELFWDRDEGRARALAREAMNQAVAHLREAKEEATWGEGQRFDLDDYIRFLNLLASRDVMLALEFLQMTRSLWPEERQKKLELELAFRIAKSDPQTALRIAEKHFDGELDYQAINLWGDLLRKDPKVASALTERIISDLKSRDIPGDRNASDRASRVLNILKSRANEIARAQNDSDAGNAFQHYSTEIQQAYRGALEVVVAAALKVTPALLRDFEEARRGWEAQNFLAQVKTLLPDIEKYLPSRAAAARAKLAQFDKVLHLPPDRQGPSSDDIEDMVKNKSPDDLITMAAASGDESVKVWLRLTAVVRLTDQGDTTRARQALKGIPEEAWKDEWMQQFLVMIERKEREHALREGKLEEARNSVSRLRWDEQRAQAWIDLAAKAEAGKDRKLQRELLDEAGGLLGDQMETHSQVEAQLELAAASLNLDPDRSFEILGSVLDRLDAVRNAEATSAKFNRRRLAPTGVVTDGGDMDDEKDVNVYDLPVSTLDWHLLAFARKDFDRVAAALRRSQVREFRLTISLMLLEKILGAESGSDAYSRPQFPNR